MRKGVSPLVWTACFSVEPLLNQRNYGGKSVLKPPYGPVFNLWSAGFLFFVFVTETPLSGYYPRVAVQSKLWCGSACLFLSEQRAQSLRKMVRTPLCSLDELRRCFEKNASPAAVKVRRPERAVSIFYRCKLSLMVVAVTRGIRLVHQMKPSCLLWRMYVIFATFMSRCCGYLGLMTINFPIAMRVGLNSGVSLAER